VASCKLRYFNLFEFFDHTGYIESDLDAYFGQLKIPKPHVTSVSVDGAKNHPTGDLGGPDGQVTLDIEAAGAVAPGANIVAYFAPNTGRGFLDAVLTALADKENRPSILSISWGQPEVGWQAIVRKQLDEAFKRAAITGITVLCAAGDRGVTDGIDDGEPHVDFPARPQVRGYLPAVVPAWSDRARKSIQKQFGTIKPVAPPAGELASFLLCLNGNLKLMSRTAQMAGPGEEYPTWLPMQVRHPDIESLFMAREWWWVVRQQRHHSGLV
jgi:hypothetical protein